MTEAPSTKPGFVNRNGQVVIRNTGAPGNDHGQKVYQIGCSKCGEVYGANGTDIFERKCPKCGSGMPGFNTELNSLFGLAGSVREEVIPQGLKPALVEG
jgi:PHP family Zn ribbon phosphoesterase